MTTSGDILPRTRRLSTLLVLVSALAVIAAACGNDAPSGAGTTPATAPATSTAGGSLVWPAPADASAAAAKAGLPMLDKEVLTVHYHPHLDVLIRGAKVEVPPYLGIDVQRQRIGPLHTHDNSGIIHIESGEDIPFTLGQLFTIWGQPLSATQAGTVTAGPDEEVRVYNNGELHSGDPNSLRLTAHAEIVVWLGKKTEQPVVPTSYTFPPGV